MSGSIALVGTGPVSYDHMICRARAAIAEADVAVGYVSYIKGMADLLEGEGIIRKGTIEEPNRACNGIPLTHRDLAASCVFLPGHLADATSSQLFYQGLAANTPAVIVRDRTRPAMVVEKVLGAGFLAQGGTEK